MSDIVEIGARAIFSSRVRSDRPSNDLHEAEAVFRALADAGYALVPVVGPMLSQYGAPDANEWIWQNDLLAPYRSKTDEPR